MLAIARFSTPLANAAHFEAQLTTALEAFPRVPVLSAASLDKIWMTQLCGLLSPIGKMWALIAER
jgi:hypothetical protein